MKGFQTKWDNRLEALAIRMDNCKTSEAMKTYIDNNVLIVKLKSVLNIKLPMLYSFIAKCNNSQAPVIKLKGKEFTMTYQARKFLVYSLASLPLMFNRKGFIRRYTFWSMFFCRETFNPRYYKFNHSFSGDNKSTSTNSNSNASSNKSKI